MNETDKQPETGASHTGAPVGVCTASASGSHLPVPSLLAIDCGLKTGLALFDLSGKLLWYRSRNFGSRARLKKAVWQILTQTAGLQQLVVEGGGPLADTWVKAGEKRGLRVTKVQAEHWRKVVLLPRQQRSGKKAKQVADDLARELIEQSGAAKPTSLRHDAAEAILVGWWAITAKRP
jgi:hypothetical protein